MKRELFASDLRRLGWQRVHVAPEAQTTAVRAGLDASGIAVMELDAGPLDRR